MTAYEIPAQDLPLWMRRARRGVDWGILICIALSVLAALPFLTQPGLPRTNASENYVFRAADYAKTISEGRLYPRWSGSVFGGYGAPIPSFFPPGAAYIPALIQFFFSNDPVTAVRVVYVLSLVIAGSAMYALVLRRAGAAAGVLASALYVYSPYVSLVAPHILGDLPSVMSLALLPSLLWSVDRLLCDNRPVDVPLVALCAAALLLTHPQLALVGYVMSTAYTLWHLGTRQPSGTIITALALGIGLAAFFWLPALAEQDAVTWRSNGEMPSLLLTPSALLTPLQPVDPYELLPTPQLSLGLPLLVFTTLGIAACITFRNQARFHLLFLGAGIALLACAFVAAPQATSLLGPIVMCLSIAGASPLLWRSKAPRLYFPALVALSIGLSATAWFVPAWTEEFGSTDALAQVQHEQLGYGVAVVPAGMAIPATTSDTLMPNQTLINSLTADSVQKIEISDNARLGVVAHTTHSDRFQIEMQSPGRLHILTAWFPGWAASLNNSPVSLQRDAETGLLNVEIPRVGSLELTVTLHTTPVRTVAWLVSFGALVLLILITIRQRTTEPSATSDPVLLSVPDARLVLLVVFGFGALMFLFASPLSPVRLTTRPGYALDGSIPLHSRTEAGLEVLSYRLSGGQYSAGDTLPLALYWRTLRFLPANYRVQVSLFSLADGGHYAVMPLRHPGGYPTQRWLTNRYVTDSYHLTLSEAIPEGDYALAVEILNCSSVCDPQNRLTFFDENGETLGQTLVLPEVLSLQT